MTGFTPKPIQIGDVSIDSPVLLAPMTGVSDLPFRKMVKRFGVGMVVSEMIASKAVRGCECTVLTG